MEQEDIELLLKEFSGRLHYGLIVSPVDCGKARLIGCLLDSVLLQDIRTGKYYDKPWDIEYVKPYLRPMSSMTEEEINEFEQITDNLLDNGTSEEIWNTVIDWLNAHHFDYRGLIGKGLAIEAPNDMYKT
jgi:hypothetical protein